MIEHNVLTSIFTNKNCYKLTLMELKNLKVVRLQTSPQTNHFESLWSLWHCFNTTPSVVYLEDAAARRRQDIEVLALKSAPTFQPLTLSVANTRCRRVLFGFKTPRWIWGSARQTNAHQITTTAAMTKRLKLKNGFESTRDRTDIEASLGSCQTKDVKSDPTARWGTAPSRANLGLCGCAGSLEALRSKMS